MKSIPAIAFALQVIAAHAQTVDVWITAGAHAPQILTEARATARGALLLFDAGDLLDTEPAADTAAELAYDALVPAERDLRQGLAAYSELLARSRATGISANVVSKDVPNLVPCRIWEINGVRVALTSVLDPALVPALKLEDPAAALKRLVPSLRSAADITLVISHGPWDQALALARGVPEIDAVIAGHAPEGSETVNKTLVISSAPVLHLEVSAGERTRGIRADRRSREKAAEKPHPAASALPSR
jgi:2',3'-cyclic-nucleotide 2'-phosphodiesterase (5'-nucleotidase family)